MKTRDAFLMVSLFAVKSEDVALKQGASAQSHECDGLCADTNPRRLHEYDGETFFYMRVGGRHFEQDFIHSDHCYLGQP